MYRIMFLLLLTTIQAAAQTTIPFSSSRWKISGKEAVQETHLGQPALRLLQATALLEDADFRNGIIEFDIALEKARYFPGIHFRMQDERNYEEYYLRPHQSGNPDAQQYTPVNNGQAGWQLFYGPGFNGAVTLPFDRWLHVRMLVSGKQAEIYLDHADTPALSIYPLRREADGGMISLSNPAPARAWYSNFSYTKTDDVPLQSRPAPAPPLPAGTITSWQVSTPFSEKLVNGHHWLGTADTAALQWQELRTDAAGLADISQLAGVSEQGNTVFARKVINTAQAGIRKLTFGFSDRARVYLNGRLLYAGEDNFLSRDYRFLGTLGYFDAVYLDLQKGRNELWIAVSENFGGWGIKAKLE